MMESSDIERSYRYCEDIIKKNSKSFYFAFSKLPLEKRNAIYAIYAFCRTADDAIDKENDPLEQKKNIDYLFAQLEVFFGGMLPKEVMWISLEDVFSRYSMNPDAFRLQLEGQRQDITFHQPDTIDMLYHYSYLVASSVGMMMLPIIATENYQELQQQAIDLGIAMQLTNILRDIGEDYHQNKRIYIPKDLMERYSVTEDMFEEKKINASFIQMWEDLAVKAEEKYRLFYEKLYLFDQDSQYQLRVASKLYSEILNTIRQNNYNVLNKRNKVSPNRMKQILNECKQ